MRYNLIYKKGKKEIRRIVSDARPELPEIGEVLELEGERYQVRDVKYIIFSKNKNQEDTTDVIVLCGEEKSPEESS